MQNELYYLARIFDLPKEVMKRQKEKGSEMHNITILYSVSHLMYTERQGTQVTCHQRK